MRRNAPAGFASFAVKYCLFAAGLVAVTAAIGSSALGMVYGIVFLLVGGTAAAIGCIVGLTGVLRGLENNYRKGRAASTSADRHLALASLRECHPRERLPGERVTVTRSMIS